MSATATMTATVRKQSAASPPPHPHSMPPVSMAAYQPVSFSSYHFPAAPVHASSPSPRPRAANKSERRRSVPLAPLAATAEEETTAPKKTRKQDRQDRQHHQERIDRSVPARSLYERRRDAGGMSPTLTVNTASTASTANTASMPGMPSPGYSALHTARSIQSDRASQRSATSDSFSVHRLRSNSGLSLHTNSAALRRYMDYNADGSSRLSPTHERQRVKEKLSGELDGLTLDDRSSDAAPSSPSFGGLLAWETVRAVLDHPVARQRLWEYTRATGGSANLEFLEKVEAYAAALHGVTALMATISTTFTCVSATQPLRLPAHLTKALNTDVKHVSSSILPGLEMLFSDVDAHIKDRVLRHIYPAFAKHQLRLRLKAALGAPSARARVTDPPFEFAGLGRAFCLTDPHRPDSPIVYASDGFASLLGYDRAEDIPRTGRVFRGPEPTHAEKENNNQEQFAEELVASRNHRDNRPFWSLVAVCPLRSASGRVRFILSGLIDVTDAVKSQDAIMHALSAPPLPDAPALSAAQPAQPAQPGNVGGRRLSVTSAALPPPPPPSPPVARPPSRADKISRSAFFNPFSRRRKAAAAAADDAGSVRGSVRASSGAGKASPALRDAAPAATRAAYAPSTGETSPRDAPRRPDLMMPTSGLSSSLPRPAAPLSANDMLATYARFMVLQFVPGSSHDTGFDAAAAKHQRRGSFYSAGMPLPVTQPQPQPPFAQTATGSGCRLKVASSSIPMLELLGLGAAARDAVMYHDVFAVLSELAGSPSITPVFRASVRQRIVASESASLELCVPASSGVPGVSGAPGALSAGLGAGLPSASGDGFSSGVSRRASLRLGSRRLSRHEDEVLPAGGGKMQRLMSHWTPLKDVDGAVAWVILVVSPIVE